MASGSDFETAFPKYVDEVLRATSEEAKAFLFLEFVRKSFSGVTSEYADVLYPVLQKHLTSKKSVVALSGRPDAMLGNLIIEFKQDLSRQLPDAESQLRTYVAILWTNQGKTRSNYQLMACDGTRIHAYRPSSGVPPGMALDPKDIKLEPLDEIDFATVKKNIETAFVWLDRYILFKTKIPPTGSLFAERFGRDSPSYRQAEQLLREAWLASKSSAQTVYEEWARYLRYVYGGEVASEELFLKHTYLATLAKLVVHAYYSSEGSARDDLVQVLQGLAFRRLNIVNFLEEDFFSWIGRNEAEEKGVLVGNLILDVLHTFDLSNVDEDVLKQLYQELVDPSERHDLGEYYTPDWLAEMIVEDALKGNPRRRVLDPSAGSGTFLVSALHFKKRKLARMKPARLLNHLGASVVGIDIHPLAVIVAKANYLIAVKDLLKRRQGPFVLPVYMANSIVLPAEVQEYAVDSSVKSYVRTVSTPSKKVTLRIPTAVAEDPTLTDSTISTIRDFAKSTASIESANKKAFVTGLERTAPGIMHLPSRQVIEGVLFETALGMKQLMDEGKDTIWAFILRNVYRPLFLSKEPNRFDCLVGNPPWLSFRYIEDVDYQREVKTLMTKYDIFPEASLVTQMELATLFLLRTADLYLKGRGRISFVMPRSIFSADQHNRFRRRTKIVAVRRITDLEGVSPLFNVPSCVVSATKAAATKYPVSGSAYEGELPAKNSGLEEARRILRRKATRFVLSEVGDRTFLMEGKEPLKFAGRSAYYARFTQGATIVPHSCWFVDLKPDPKLGFDPSFPYLASSKKATTTAKSEYKGVEMKGNVESRFLYAVVTGTELVPFATTTLQTAVLPIEPLQSGYKMLDSSAAAASGYTGLADWLKDAEAIWKAKRGEKARKMNLYESLDYSQKLTKQKPKAKFKVVYNAAGTNLTASVIDQDASKTVEVDGQKLGLNGVIAEHKVYRFETDDEREAHYLVSVLNSRVLDRLLKPLQSRGQWGERDIEKKPLEFPIPKYDRENEVHRRLAQLGEECSMAVERIVPDLEKKYSSVGKIRGEIRNTIDDKLKEIDELVVQLLGKNSDILDFFS